MEKPDILIIGGSAAGIVTGMTARKHYIDTHQVINKGE